MRAVPPELDHRAFTVAQAHAAGVTSRQLQGDRFVRIHAGVYRTAASEPAVELLADAALLALGSGHAISHLTNLRLRGMDHGPLLPIHVASTRLTQVRREGLLVHRHRGELQVQIVDGRPLTTAARTFVDLGTLMSDRALLAAGDLLIRTDQTTRGELRSFAESMHLDGVRRARRVCPHLDGAAASVRESHLRWAIIKADLPAPEVNVDILADDGAWLARGDLVFRTSKVVVEYDGWQHERDARQRQWDHLRREQLEAAGWRVIVITTQDMRAPRSVAIRIEQALRQRGWTRSSPRNARTDTESAVRKVRVRANLGKR